MSSMSSTRRSSRSFCWWRKKLGRVYGQEKYLRELSVTPVGYFTGAKSLPWAWGVPQGLFCMA
jgi:hypothetical protein